MRSLKLGCTISQRIFQKLQYGSAQGGGIGGMILGQVIQGLAQGGAVDNLAPVRECIHIRHGDTDLPRVPPIPMFPPLTSAHRRDAAVNAKGLAGGP